MTRPRPPVSIIKRLTHQLAAKGVPNARAEAVSHLQNHGVLYEGTEMLTPLGHHRQKIGAAGRAKERAARQTDGAHKPADYVFDAKANSTHLRKR